jgi:hypothetical protein
MASDLSCDSAHINHSRLTVYLVYVPPLQKVGIHGKTGIGTKNSLYGLRTASTSRFSYQERRAVYRIQEGLQATKTVYRNSKQCPSQHHALISQHQRAQAPSLATHRNIAHKFAICAQLSLWTHRVY